MRVARSIVIFFLFCAGIFVSGGKALASGVARAESAARPPVIVIGFVGGFVKHDNMVHSPVQIAAHLREAYPEGVYVEVFENRRRKDAHQKILDILDTDHDGKLSDEEKEDARIIIYGISWGASETVALAKRLEKDGIPVMLTIQVDSVAKWGENDSVIPANVVEAVNFYQPHGLLHGQANIRAADGARTRILGNFRFDYKSKAIPYDKYPWFVRAFAKGHTKIECDPVVWNQVDSLIREKLVPVATTKLGQ